MSSPQALHRQLFWKNLCIRHLVFSLFYSHSSKRFRQQVLWGKDFPSCLPQAVWICNIHTLEEKEVFPLPKGSFFLKSPCTCFPLCSQRDLLIADCKNTTQGSSEWNCIRAVAGEEFPRGHNDGAFFLLLCGKWHGLLRGSPEILLISPAHKHLHSPSCSSHCPWLSQTTGHFPKT